jgi:prolipoprotein diacylglyceryltransferase
MVGSGFYFGFCLATIFTFRFLVEFCKEVQVDFEQGMALDMGQILSIPFMLIGAYFIYRGIKLKIKAKK